MVFSQVMAGCSQKLTRGFLCHMCGLHKLSEMQRLQLLEHMISHSAACRIAYDAHIGIIFFPVLSADLK